MRKRTKAKPTLHPCAFCGKGFRKSQRRVGANVILQISRKGGWPPLPRAQRYCSQQCKDRAAKVRERSGQQVAPARMTDRQPRIVDGRLSYVTGHGTQKAEPLMARCGECGESVKWTANGRPPKFCSAKCRVKNFRRTSAAASAVEQREKRKK